MRIVTALTRTVTSYWAGQLRFLVTALRVQRMEQIEDVSIEPCTNSKFIQPYRVKYKQVSSELLQKQIKLFSCFYSLCSHAQNGQQKLWDCIKMHDR